MEPPAAQLAEQMAANDFSFPRQQTTFDVFLVITDSRPDFCDQHTFARRVEMAMKWLGSQVKEDWVKIGEIHMDGTRRVGIRRGI